MAKNKATKKTAKKAVKIVNIESIHQEFFVRRSLDEDMVIQFAEALEAGAKFPPIEVVDRDDGGYILVNGRHRLAANNLNSARTMSVRVLASKPRHALIQLAMADNMGGSKPPTRSDIQFATINAIEAGAKVIDVQRGLEKFYPTSVASRFINDARSNINARRTRKALTLMADGATIESAAKEAGVGVKSIKGALVRKKKKTREYGTITAVKGGISHRLRSFAQKNAAALRVMFVDLEEDVTTIAQIQDVIDQIRRAAHTIEKAADENQARLNSRIAAA
jgi:hypothetical protein